MISSETCTGSTPHSPSSVAAGLFSFGDTAASRMCSVRGHRWPRDLAIARARSSSRLVWGATPSDPLGRGACLPSRCSMCWRASSGVTPSSASTRAAKLVRLSEHAEDQMLGPDVLVAERACLVRGRAQHAGAGARQAERRLAGGGVGQRGEPLVGGLLGGPQARADLAPAGAIGSRRIHELVQEFVTAGAEPVGEDGGGGQPIERRSGWDLGLEPVDVREGGHGRRVKTILTVLAASR